MQINQQVKFFTLFCIIFVSIQGKYSSINGNSVILSADSDSSKTEKKNNFSLSLKSGNNISQFGRKMTTNQYYIQPAFNYSRNNGIYAGFQVTYLPSAKKKPVDNFSINTGYEKDLGDYFSIGIDYTYTRYFTSKQLASSNPHSISLSTSWYNTIISPTLSGNLSFGENKDFTTCLDLSHVFTLHRILTKADKLSFPLMTGIYAGTSSYYNTYLKKNQITTDSITVPSSFKITSTYVCGSVKYTISHFSLAGMANYLIIIHPSKKEVKSNRPILSVQLALNI